MRKLFLFWRHSAFEVELMPLTEALVPLRKALILRMPRRHWEASVPLRKRLNPSGRHLYLSIYPSICLSFLGNCWKLLPCYGKVTAKLLSSHCPSFTNLLPSYKKIITNILPFYCQLLIIYCHVIYTLILQVIAKSMLRYIWSVIKLLLHFYKAIAKS